MLERLAEKFINKKHAVGVNIRMGDGSIDIAYAVLQEKEGIINIISKKSGLPTYEALRDEISKLNGVKVYLNIEGKGVLYKKSKHVERDTLSDIVEDAFPGVNVKDFFIQVVHGINGSFVSIVRKELAESIVGSLGEVKIHVSNLNLGPFALKYVLPFVIGQEEETPWLGGYRITTEGQDIAEIKIDNRPSNSIVGIGDEKLSSDYHVAYAVGLQHFLVDEQFRLSDSKVLLDSASEFVQGQMFNKLGKIVLGVLLGVVAVNFMVFLWFNSIYVDLSGQFQFKSNVIQKLELLDKEVNTKKVLLKNLGWSFDGRYAFYGDRLAATLPSGMKWTGFEINPMDEAILKNDRKQQFAVNEILVKGKCTNPTILNNWIMDITKSEWVVRVSGQKYTYDEYTKMGDFELKLSIRH